MQIGYGNGYTVKFHDLSFFSVECDGQVLVFDPHDGISLGLPVPIVRNANIVLCSHAHYDHNAGKDLVGKPAACILEEEAGDFEFEGVQIRGTRVRHGGDPRWGYSVVYSVKFASGPTFIHLGDIGYFPSESELTNILHWGRPDVLFTPIGGEFTIDAATAVRLADAIHPRHTTVGCHFLYGPLREKPDFAGMVDERAFVQLAGHNLSRVSESFSSETTLQRFTIFDPKV